MQRINFIECFRIKYLRELLLYEIEITYNKVKEFKIQLFLFCRISCFEMIISILPT